VPDLVRREVASVRSAAMAPTPRRIPEATVARLPVYQRLLMELVRAGTTVASDRLAELASVNASKVRKDLSFLGSFGTRGSGYDAQYLLSQIDRELGLDGDWPVVIVGLGNLGRALANSHGFMSRGFRIAGLFDVEPSLVGTWVRGVQIRHVDNFEGALRDDPPEIGVIATPAADAQAVAERFVRVGARRAPAVRRPEHRAPGDQLLSLARRPGRKRACHLIAAPSPRPHERRTRLSPPAPVVWRRGA
jgi:redox-sensing transcriptional repressor